MLHLKSERLVLREFTADDAPFVRVLLADPGYLRFIGDRGVRTDEDAARFVEERLRPSYAAHGDGLLLVTRREDGEPLGTCGLVRRPWLDGPDLGFAFLEAHTGRGYAREAAATVLAAAARRERFVLAITLTENERSVRLLEDLDFRYERQVRAPGAGEELALFRWDTAEVDPPAAGRPPTDVDLEVASEAAYVCPSCGEEIVIPLDVAAGSDQRYVEDCPVCCSPNVLSVHLDDDGTPRLAAEAE